MRRDPIQQALLQDLPPNVSLCVAFSGGRDSTVLLHALACLRAERQFILRAAHVNHGIHADAQVWAEHCAAVADRLDVPYSALAVTVRNDSGQGLEAAARESRYGALRSQLQPAEWLLTAHHADDQLETVLLHLFRGSGLDGLAGIPRDRRFGPGRLHRPLLAVPVEAIASYAAMLLRPAGIGWLVDPMNADTAYDRGYVRHKVAPILRHRFPAAAGAAGRSAALAAEAAGLLDELARGDAEGVGAGHRLALAPLRALSPARQRNLVRFQVRELGWAIPPERRLREGLAQLLGAAPGRQPVLRWSGHEIRRFRQHLHLLDSLSPDMHPAEALVEWFAPEPLVLGSQCGALNLRRTKGTGLAAAVVAEGLQVGFRSGGELMRAGADRHHRTLKYLFQSHGVVPWMRSRVPLVFARAQLAAVADLWIADWAAARPGDTGFQIVWSHHAPIH